MSLKAKIEAVIYASEEPVTLLQLAGLLGLEAQAELHALEARQQQLDLTPGTIQTGSEDADRGGADGSEGLSEAAAEGDVNADAVAGVPDAGEATREDLGGGSDGALGSVSESGPESAAEKRRVRDRERRVREYLAEIVAQLIADYVTSERGLEVREVAGGYRMATKPEYHDAVRGFVKSLKPPLRLSLQALETLAVVAYKQPVTAPEISEIRGVDSGGVLGSLMSRKLISTAGRKQVIGRPILYKTTKDFLLRFGLKDTSELPSIEEFEKMAGELAEQEEIPMRNESMESAEERITHENLEEEKHAVEPQADGDSDSLNENDSNLPEGETPAVDGRMSGLPPRDEAPGDDPSADEAAIQNEENGGV